MKPIIYTLTGVAILFILLFFATTTSLIFGILSPWSAIPGAIVGAVGGLFSFVAVAFMVDEEQKKASIHHRQGRGTTRY